MKCNLEGAGYKIFGYQGKQVRDNIHAFDVASFIERFIASPRAAEVYNIGGGRDNSCSILEAIALIEEETGRPQAHTFLPDHRIGDHICYISNLGKMRAHYPGWEVTVPLQEIVRQIAGQWRR